MFDMSKRGGRNPELDIEEEPESESPRSTRPAAPGAPPAKARGREAAVVGPSIHIDGDLRGEEDLVIEGSVTGTIHLEDYSLTIGASGKVKAEVYAESIVVDGSVEGDLYGAERISIRRSGDVKGNIVSPRVSLEDGGRFKGNVEMDQQAVESAFGARRPQASPKAAAGGGAAAAPSGKDREPAVKAPAPETAQGDKKSAAG